TIDRHPNVVETESGNVYQRHGAQNLRLQGEQLEALRRSKGNASYELTTTHATVEELENSLTMIDFMVNGRVFSEPRDFLEKNRLVASGVGVIAGTVLFSDLPQAHLPYAAVKIYRYRTSGQEDRSHLAGVPETIEGPVTQLISQTKGRIEE